MVFETNGIRIPLAYTIWAKREILKQFKDVDGVQKAFVAEDDVELAENMAIFGSIMSKAYYQRKKLLDPSNNDGHPIESDDLFSILVGEDILKLVDAISKSVAEANQTTIETISEKKERAMQ